MATDNYANNIKIKQTCKNGKNGSLTSYIYFMKWYTYLSIYLYKIEFPLFKMCHPSTFCSVDICHFSLKLTVSFNHFVKKLGYVSWIWFCIQIGPNFSRMLLIWWDSHDLGHIGGTLCSSSVIQIDPWSIGSQRKLEVLVIRRASADILCLRTTEGC